MAINVEGTFKLWDNKSVAPNETSPEIFIDIAEILGVYFKVNPSVDIALEAYVKDQWIEVYRWTNPGTDWVFDAFPIPMAQKVRLKALDEATITAYLEVKR
jgi:hypothetical protein